MANLVLQKIFTTKKSCVQCISLEVLQMRKPKAFMGKKAGELLFNKCTC
jgi:hypothetical protein